MLAEWVQECGKVDNFPTPPGTALFNKVKNISWFGSVLLFWRSQKKIVCHTYDKSYGQLASLV